MIPEGGKIINCNFLTPMMSPTPTTTRRTTQSVLLLFIFLFMNLVPRSKAHQNLPICAMHFWCSEKLWFCRDLPDGGLTKHFTYDDLLTNVMIYWINGNIGPSMRFYKEQFHNLDRLQNWAR